MHNKVSVQEVLSAVHYFFHEVIPEGTTDLEEIKRKLILFLLNELTPPSELAKADLERRHNES